MNVSLDSVGRGMQSPFPAGAGEASPAAKPAESWKTREIGSAELAKVVGEETVDEEELTRDDSLGSLVSRAFDPAGMTLPKLFE